MGGSAVGILVGNLGRDPEIRMTQSNKKVANFSVAVSRSWKDQQGEWQEETSWIDVVAWGYSADKVEKSFAKGKQVYVMGDIQTRKWTDRDGNNRVSTEINARNLYLTGRKEEGGKPAGVGDSNHFEPPPLPPEPTPAEDDDLPF